MWSIKRDVHAWRLGFNRIREHEGAVGVHEIGSVTSGEAAEDETFGRIKRRGQPGSTISSRRLFSELSWERLTRVGEHARPNPSGKNVSANAEMSARKKNTLAIGRRSTTAREVLVTAG